MGLLDVLSDQNADPEQRMALQRGLLTLGATLMGTPGKFSSAMGGATMAGMQGYDQALNQARAAKLSKAQLADIENQAMLRKAQANEIERKQQMLAPFMAKLAGNAPTASPATQAMGQGAAMGDVGPTTGNAQRMGQIPQQPQPGGVSALNLNDIAAAKLGGLPDLMDVWKAWQPNWQNVNGNMVNTNDPNFKGGFQPGVFVSQDGKASQVTPDGRGGVQVSAPAGAVQTYSGYKRADAEFKPMKVYNPATGGEEWTSEAAVLAPKPMTRGEIRADMQSPGTQFSSPAAKNAAMRAAGMPQAAGAQAGPTAAQGRENDFAAGLNKAQTEKVITSASAAEGAQRTLETIGRIDGALSSGKVMAGPGTSAVMLFKQIGNAMGLAGDEALTKTRTVIQSSAELTLNSRSMLQGQGQITDREQALLERARSVDVDKMTGAELKEVMNILRDKSKIVISQHNDFLKRANPSNPMDAFSVTGTPLDKAATGAGGWGIKLKGQ